MASARGFDTVLLRIYYNPDLTQTFFIVDDSHYIRNFEYLGLLAMKPVVVKQHNSYVLSKDLSTYSKKLRPEYHHPLE